MKLKHLWQPLLEKNSFELCCSFFLIGKMSLIIANMLVSLQIIEHYLHVSLN